MSDTSDFAQVVEAVRLEYEKLRELNSQLPTLSLTEENRQWFIGRLQAKGHKKQPYVAWVRGGGSFKPVGTGDLVVSADRVAIKPLITAATTVFALICGGTEIEAELLWKAIVVATHNALHTGSQPQSFRWVSQEEERAAYVNADAELVVQEFDWAFIVPSEIRRTVTVLLQSHDDQLGAATDNTQEDHT